MTNITTTDGVVVKTRRRRSAEERRKELADRLAKLDNREKARVLRRVGKIMDEMLEASKMNGASDEVRKTLLHCNSSLQPLVAGSSN